MNKLNKSFAIAAAALSAGLAAAPAAADVNPFQVADLGSGYMLAEKGAEAKCGEAKCGEAAPAKPAPEAKCGEAKCGEEK